MIRRPVTNINDGEWYRIAWIGQRERCCDCGAEHTVDFKVHEGELHFRAVRVDSKEKSRGRKRNR